MDNDTTYKKQHHLILEQMDRIGELVNSHYLGSTPNVSLENIAELSRISNDLQHIIDYSAPAPDPTYDEWLKIQDTYESILNDTRG